MSSKSLEHVTAWSTLATAAIALGALITAWVQIRSSNEAQREATAQDTYKEYLRLAVENPDLADGLGQVPEASADRSKYGWFVSYFLHSAEHAFLVNPSDEWRLAIENQVCLHKAFLAGDEYQTTLKLHYDPAFRALVDEALKECGNRAD
jgi:hypothetical protein